MGNLKEKIEKIEDEMAREAAKDIIGRFNVKNEEQLIDYLGRIDYADASPEQVAEKLGISEEELDDLLQEQQPVDEFSPVEIYLWYDHKDSPWEPDWNMEEVSSDIIGR